LFFRKLHEEAPLPAAVYQTFTRRRGESSECRRRQRHTRGHGTNQVTSAGLLSALRAPQTATLVASEVAINIAAGFEIQRPDDGRRPGSEHCAALYTLPTDIS
jgi:hypothetical protein